MTLRNSSAFLIAVLLSATAASLCQAAEHTRPLLLLYETSQGQGVDKGLAEAATRAIKTYLRDTQKVEVAIFNRESPTVQRAIMERKLTQDKVASYASQSERVEVAKELGFHYAAGAEISIKDVRVEAKSPGVLEVKPADSGDKPDDDSAKKAVVSLLEIKLWIGRALGGKAERWEAVGSGTAAGAGERDVENAMQSAASFVVNEIVRKAFDDLPRVSSPEPTNGTESIAIAPSQPVGSAVLSAADYAVRAEESARSGNLALAIQQYSQAVNADPSDMPLRVKLAEAYAARGMLTEAEDELRRAEGAGADKDMISAARKRIESAANGSRPVQPEKPQNPGATAAETKAEPPLSKPPSPAGPVAIAKIVEGDKLWREGKPDEAAEAYAESIKANPNDWRAHERLAVVNASMSLFGESRRVLEQLARVQPEPQARILENRYEMLRKAFEEHFLALLKQYETNGADFEKSIITRESYYNSVKGLSVRLESMASFLDALKPPTAKQQAHLRRSIACGLAAQAAANLLDYLESNNEKAKSNAAVFVKQARSEIDAAAKLEENRVVVERPPQPAPPAQETPQEAPEEAPQE